MEGSEKPRMKVVIPNSDSTMAFRSPPDDWATRMIKNICERNLKTVSNAVFQYEDLREDLTLALSKQLAREMAEYIHSDSMLKCSAPTELSSFSNRKLVQ